jgi:flagellar hook-associated protein 1 FlgK
MPTLFSGINLALQSLLSQQQAIDVVNHNVANANTPGYHRQEAIMATTVPYSPAGMEHYFGSGQIGTGVMVEQIKRFSLDFMDTRYRQEQAKSSQFSTSQSVLDQVEATLAENSTDGLVPQLDQFWSAWQTLSTDPTNMALRADLHDKATSLANAFHERATSLTAIQKDQDQAVIQRVDEINNDAAQVATLNQQISHVLSTGDAPNDLLDKRAQLLDRLSELAGATSSVQANGEAIVSIGGHALVVGHDTFQLNATPVLANGNMVQVGWADGGTFTASTGELGGLLQVRDQIIPNQLTGLNDLAGKLIQRVNQLHQTGYGLNNATTQDFFTGADASDINLSAAMDTLENIAVSSASGTVGDGSIALKIADVQNELLMNGGTTTLNQFYNVQATSLGLLIKQNEADATSHASIAKSLSDQRESVSGVSLDEEAANMVKFQRAYQASARMMSVMDDLLNTVINNMGAGH